MEEAKKPERICAVEKCTRKTRGKNYPLCGRCWFGRRSIVKPGYVNKLRYKKIKLNDEVYTQKSRKSRINTNITPPVE